MDILLWILISMVVSAIIAYKCHTFKQVTLASSVAGILIYVGLTYITL